MLSPKPERQRRKQSNLINNQVIKEMYTMPVRFVFNVSKLLPQHLIYTNTLPFLHLYIKEKLRERKTSEKSELHNQYYLPFNITL